MEAGGKFYDCDPNQDGDGNGIPDDDGKNPYLTGYGPTSLPMDFDRLAYDPTVVWTVTDPAGVHPPVQRSGVVLLDGNGNGRLDAVPGDPNCYDVNRDGWLDIGEDYLFRPLASYDTGTLLLHYSIEAAHQAQVREVFGATWPSDVAQPSQNDAYWALRDATFCYQILGAVRPDLHCLLAFAAADHVQAADEHPHIQQAYDGLRGMGIWCRPNPDEVYYRLVDPAPPRPPADNDANIPISWPDMPGYDEDYPLSSTVGALAAVMEMADRARAGDWSPDLAGPVTAVDDGPSDGKIGLRITPNPATPASRISWKTPGAGWGSLRLFDVAGRRCGELETDAVEHGGSVELGRLLPRGSSLASGVYWLELRAGSRRMTRSLLAVDR